MNNGRSVRSHSPDSPESPERVVHEERTFDPSIPPKKRIRVPNSCIICRKRKIKCNQVRPSCDQCLKRKVPHLCHYEDPQWMHFVRDRAEPIKQHSVGGVSIEHVQAAEQDRENESSFQDLLARLRHLEGAVNLTQWFGPDETVPSSRYQSLIPPANDTYDPKEPVELVDKQPFLVPFIMRKFRIEFHGCFSPLMDIKKDDYVKVVWLHMWRYLDLAIQDRLTSGNQSIYRFNDGPSNATIMKFLEVRKKKTAYKKVCQTLVASKRSLDDIILEYLPQRRVILSLCTRYFKYLYPLFPLLDEHTFLMEDIVRIFGEWNNPASKPEKLSITTTMDYALIGLLFIIMAISALTLQKEELEHNFDFRLLKDASTAIYSYIAKMCAEHYELMRKSANPKIFLLMIHLKLYNEMCPENDTISDRTMGKIELGLIHSMVRASGIHVDPSHLAGPGYEGGGFKLWMKLWHKLMDMDATESIVMGHVPMYPDDSSYDTKLPEYSIDLTETEIFVINDYHFMKKKTDLYRRLSTTLFQRKRTPTLGQLMELIEEVETFSVTELGSLKDMLENNPQPYARVKKVTYLLELSTLHASLIQRTVSHAHKTKNDKFIHQQFIRLISSLMKILNSALNICYNIERYFGALYYIFIRPTLYTAVARTSLSFPALLSRCLQCIKRTPLRDRARLSALRELRAAILVNMERSSQLSLKVNNGYSNAQRINLGLSFFLMMIRDPSFDFDKAVEDVTNRPIPDELTRPHDLHGVKKEDITDTNFLANLLLPELNCLRDQLEADINDVLKPLIGDGHVDIPQGQPIFSPEGGPPASHYDNLPVDFKGCSVNGEDEKDIQKTISFTYMKNKVATILGGVDTINRSCMMTPSQLAGEEESNAGYIAQADKDLVLTSEEFSDLFGLFDEYAWFKDDDSPAFDVFNNVT